MIPTIRPKKTKLNIELTDEHIKYIQQVLERSCTGSICISSSALYEASKLKFSIQTEPHQFKIALKQAFTSGKITGFETRTGRTGGICRAGAFVNHVSSKRTCSVSINNAKYKVSISENKIITFITFMGGVISDKGNVIINNKLYLLPKLNTIDVLINFLETNNEAE